MIKIIILILVLLIAILLFIPISIRVIYDDSFSDIDVFLFKYIRHKFDLTLFIRKFITDNNKISFITILNNFQLLINSQNTLKDIMKTVKINKSTVILKDSYDDYIKFILFWNIVTRYSCFLKENFKNVENEYYMITNAKRDISFELIFNIKIINIIISIIKNYKEMVKIIKIKRRQKKDGTSNL